MTQFEIGLSDGQVFSIPSIRSRRSQVSHASGRRKIAAVLSARDAAGCD